MRLTACLVLLLAIGWGAAPLGAAEPPAPAGRVTLLNAASLWRSRMSTGTELVRLASGKLAPVHPDNYLERRVKKVDGKRQYETLLRLHPRTWVWPLPPDGWRTADFDDRAWPALPAPFCMTGYYKAERARYRSVPLLCLRGAFHVQDPARTGDLEFSVSFRGGFAAWLNGRELIRSHLAEGELRPDTPAEDYPTQAYADDNGLLLDRKMPDKKYAARYKMRQRMLRKVKVPAALLRKGVNVLALELHRAPAPELFFMAKSRRKTTVYTNPQHVRQFAWWSRIGLESVELTAPAGAPATPNAGGASRPKGFRVWNRRLVERLWPSTGCSPFEPLRPVRLCGARNGAYTAQLVVSSDKAIAGLTATCGRLAGPDGAALPESAAQVRAGLPEVAPRRGKPWFAGLDDHLPARIEPDKAAGGAILPVYLTVRVPADARPGQYRGTLTLSADAQKPVEIPVQVQVVDWTLPDPRQFVPQAGAFQSPDSIAMWYKVPMWSDRHWALVERSLQRLGELGTKDLYLTAIRQTHLGNQHGIIRFVKGADGALTPDFSIAEKYLGLAVKHLGKVPMVCVYCWETFDSGGKYHFGHYARKNRPILITLLDPKSGALSEAEGPAWGTPACRAFWKPVFDGVRAILAKHGIERSMMAGICGDFEPTDAALEDIKAASGGVPWVSNSHVVRRMIGPKKNHPTGYIASAWGGHTHHTDPDFGRGYGWKNPFPRVMTRGFPGAPINQRFLLEALVASRIMPRGKPFQPDWGLYGFGRMGADFWPVLGTRRKRPLLGRYPKALWGQLNVALWMPALLAPGRDGAVHTVRSEMVRLNQQELAARVFIEKALADPAARATLGAELAARVQELLDQRVRAALLAYAKGDRRAALSLDVDAMSAELFRAAAQVDAALKRR